MFELSLRDPFKYSKIPIFFVWILLGSFGLWYVVEIDYLGEGMKSIFACFVSAFIGVSALAAVQSIQVETNGKRRVRVY